MENGKKNIAYRQNPKIDFLFGYFGELQVPTKQDAFKPINVIHTDENGVETILKDFYVKKPETKSVNNFKNTFSQLQEKNSLVKTL